MVGPPLVAENGECIYITRNTFKLRQDFVLFLFFSFLIINKINKIKLKKI